MAETEFQLLGPIEIRRAGQRVTWPHQKVPKVRCLLAALLYDAGRPVPLSTLIERVWGDAVIGEATRYKYAGWLRADLREVGVGLETTGDGYRLPVDPDRVDLLRFRALLGGPRSGPVLEGALRLWHGEALTGVPGDWAARVREGLAAERRSAERQLFQLRLDAGEAESIVDQLSARHAERPTDEALTQLLMVARYRTAGPAAALEAYEETVRAVTETLAAAPGPELTQLAERIRAGDPELRGNASSNRRAAPAAGPKHLPGTIARLTGRQAELRRLRELAADPSSRVITVVGAPGIGKTTLALWWAHEQASRYPDGQLHLDLHGFSPGEKPDEPAEALAELLVALGAARDRIPLGLAARTRAFRDRLADRRVLLILDNAHDADQVRPLLPPTSSGLAVVTSRNDLTGLVITDQAQPLFLSLLDDRSATEMVVGHTGAGRDPGEAAAVTTLVSMCGGLPLALSLVAARITLPGQTPSRVARDLGTRRLHGLAVGDRATDPRIVFAGSYDHLDPSAANLLRLLGLHPGPDIGLTAAACLAGEDPDSTSDALHRLSHVSLVQTNGPGRFALHDLLREYAAELSTEDVAQAAVDRVLDHYLRTAGQAALRLNPSMTPLPISGKPVPGAMVHEFASAVEADRWIEDNLAVLHRTLTWALRWERPRYTALLPAALALFLDKRGSWRAYHHTQRLALDAARATGDQTLAARAEAGLGRALIHLGDRTGAVRHLTSSLDLYDTLGDHAGAARTAVGLARAHGDEALDKAVHAGQRALAEYRAIGDRAGEADALNSVAWFSARRGTYAEALPYAERALNLQQHLGAGLGEGDAWDTIGYIRQALGDRAGATAAYRAALTIFTAFGHRYYEADTQTHLGDALAIDDARAARAAWSKALAIFDDLDHQDAEKVRRRLAYPADTAFDIDPDAEKP